MERKYMRDKTRALAQRGLLNSLDILLREDEKAII